MLILSFVQTVGFGWAIIADENIRNIVSNGVLSVFAIYTFVISVLAIGHNEIFWHGRFTVHLAALTTTALVLLAAISILPSSLTPETPQRIVWYTSLALWLVSFWLSVHMRRGPSLHFPPERIYADKVVAGTTAFSEDNVCGIVGASPWEVILFSYTTKVVMLGYTAESLEIGDLPIVPGSMRATSLFSRMKVALRRYRWRSVTKGSGWQLAYQIIRVNGSMFIIQTALVVVSAVLFYTPAFFLRQFVHYLEGDPERKDPSWGWVYCAGLFALNAISFLVTGQLWSLSTTSLQVSIKVQLNTILFAKTLVRKDIASSAASNADKQGEENAKDGKGDTEEGEFSSKAQIMTLMTTDVDRVSEVAWHLFALLGTFRFDMLIHHKLNLKKRRFSD